MNFVQKWRKNMTYIKQYIISQTPPFENELEIIYKYISFKLNEPNTANEFYHKTIQKIYSLQYYQKDIQEFLTSEQKQKHQEAFNR